MTEKIATVSEFSQPERTRQQEALYNPSGFQPVEYKCLVKPYHIAETDEVMKRAKAAGIELPDDQIERDQMAQCVALLVAVGGNAFEDWKPPIPKPGDRILMAKYAGVVSEGVDGRDYRTISDKDIAAVLFQPEGPDPYDVEDEEGGD